MAKILLPIKIKYAKKILSGEKDIEFRKSFPKQNVDTIVIYATSPISKVVGEVKVEDMCAEINRPLKVYSYLNQFFKMGINEKDFNKYYKGQDLVRYYNLGKVTKYEKELQDLGINYIPQNFVYLDKEK